jgi:release factor glutamine methyltransferase
MDENAKSLVREKAVKLRPRGNPLFIPPVRMIWRLFLALRFALFQRHRFDRLVLEKTADYSILVIPTVFNPKLLRTGEFFAQNLGRDLIPEGATLLDMGTGSGINAIAAARWAASVVAADINPAAVRCARINAWLNGVEDRVETVESDLFEALEGRTFDVILFNPPFYRGTPANARDHAWRAQDTLERFARSLSAHLNPGGQALVVFSSDGDVTGLLEALLAEGLEVENLKERDLVNEILVMYRVRQGRESK